MPSVPAYSISADAIAREKDRVGGDLGDFDVANVVALDTVELPDNQQDRDMIARELLLKFQMSDRHPLVALRKAYMKF